jgi:drug/metabolite transporter (DMT)-like permease
MSKTLDAQRSVAASADKRALAALFAGACGIAFAPIFVRLSELTPTATAFNRFALAVPVLWVWLAIGDTVGQSDNRPKRRHPSSVTDYAILALAGLFFAGDMGFWHWSITYTSVANATLLANMAPVFVVLGGWLLFGTRVRPLFLIGMATAMAGTAVLMQTSAGLGGRHLLGDALGLVTGLFYGAYLLTIQRLRASYDTMTIMAYAIPVSAVAMLGVSILNGETLLAVTTTGWMVVVGVALVSQVFGQSLIAYGLAQLPVAFASVSLLVQPVMAALWAWLLLAEPLGPIQAVGAAVVLAGIWIARRGSLRS